MILLIPVIGTSVFIVQSFYIKSPSQKDPLDLYVGIDAAYDNMDEIYELIDEVSSYTNLFIIGSTGISYNQTKLNEICQYLSQKDMYFIIFCDSRRVTRLQVFRDIQEKYEGHFLGLYFDDEQGGRQLDIFEWRWVDDAENYTDAATQFVYGLNWWLEGRFIGNESFHEIAPLDFHLFTSDYTCYWFDYKAGYDTVFAQFGWNYSRQLNVALCRGAATAQNKDWGAIVTWTYVNPPYIESGEELYKDLLLAYDNGAKYILVFDSDENYTQGILRDEHLEALKQFWEYSQKNPRIINPIKNRVAYVLPKDYGYGFRGPNDKVWGLWEADDLSLEISTNLGSLLEKYGTNLDIIYDDEIEYDELYGQYIFWNGTIYSPPS